MYQTTMVNHRWMIIFILIFFNNNNVNSKSIGSNDEPIPPSTTQSQTPDLNEIFIILFILFASFVVTCVIIICLILCFCYIFERLKRMAKSRGDQWQFDMENGLNRESNNYHFKAAAYQPRSTAANSPIPLKEFGQPPVNSSATIMQTVTPLSKPLSSYLAPKALSSSNNYNPNVVNPSSNNYLKNEHTATPTRNPSQLPQQNRLYPQLPTTSDDDLYQPSQICLLNASNGSTKQGGGGSSTSVESDDNLSYDEIINQQQKLANYHWCGQFLQDQNSNESFGNNKFSSGSTSPLLSNHHLYQAKNLSNPSAAKIPTFQKAKSIIFSLWKVGCLDLKLRNFGNCASTTSFEYIYNNSQHHLHQILVVHVKQLISHGLQKWKNNPRNIDKHLDLEYYFLHFNPETCEIVGSIAGNFIFETIGKDNSLSESGKKYLNDMNNGKIESEAVPFNFDHSLMPSCNLDFYAEREKCLRENKLFVDPEFPANNDSLYFCKAFKSEIVWRRPWEIIDNPQFFVSGEDRFDVVQGSIGNCWFVAGAAILALRKELFFHVVKPDQSFSENYAGIFHFQFWRYNEWVDVVIDDQLPTVRGKLYFTRSECKQEMWSALMEKAYAKLYGSYEALVGGFIAESLQDMTGGLTDNFKIRKVSKNMLSNGYKMGSLFGLDANKNIEEEETGLLHDHAYSITARHIVAEGPHKGKLLLRVRNPHGNEGDEWIGSWSDHFPEWLEISKKEKQRMKFVNRADGEFWVEYQDCREHFDELECCHLKPEFMDKFAVNKAIVVVDKAKENAEVWTSQAFHGEWNNDKGTAGGCKYYIETFADNPQYFFSISSSADGTAEENNTKCTVIIALMQKFRRELRIEGLERVHIGFAIYKLSHPQACKRQRGSFFEHRNPIAEICHLYSIREVTARFRLPPGNYILVPSTDEPEEEAEYLLRIFSNSKFKAAQQL